ncbi:unnamed protein product [Anisakis simplex]|uniref:RING-type E3 ubiquitin transferase n=1 Tax=Anisakis simplex TaxID=6269 RepID=A0A0M3JRT4_ANISI|nr:unnamed protein product [Anisakis simplex]
MDETSEEESDEEGTTTAHLPVTRSRARRTTARRAFFDDSDDVIVLDVESAAQTAPEEQRLGRTILSSDGEEEPTEPLARKRAKTDENADDTIVTEGDEAACCMICFEEYTNSGSHRLVCLKCGHLYGQSCIERWIRSEKNAKCPQCKTRARISDIRRIFARTIKMMDTTELEELRESNKAYKDENDSLRLQIMQLKVKLKKAEDNAKIATAQLSSHPASVTTSVSKRNHDELIVHDWTLSSERTVVLSSQPGTRSVHDDGNIFVVTCRIDNDLFRPYGLKLLTRDGRITTAIPVHTKRPRCCQVSPFDPRLVLSTGEDKRVCITEFGESKRVLHQFELPANGWCCCWMSAEEICVGCVNGRVLKFDVRQPTEAPQDITGGNGRRPILYVHSLRSIHATIVVSVRDCTVYCRQQQYTLLTDIGSIISFCYETNTDTFMVAFGPNEEYSTVRHVLYKLNADEMNIGKELIRSYISRSNKQTRLISCALWNVGNAHLAAIIDEAHSQLVILDWNRPNLEVLIRRIEDDVVAVKEIPVGSQHNYQVVCISETRAHLFELKC